MSSNALYELDPMGLKWMGLIPAHWSIASVKRYYDVQLGKMLQNEASNEQDILVPYLKALHVLWGEVHTEDLPQMWASPFEIRQYEAIDGDLLVCEGGEVGRASIVKSPPEKCIIQNALHRARARSSSNSKFLMYIMYSVSAAGWFDVLCNKATIAHFTREKFDDLRIPIPTLAQQERITSFLDRETARIDSLIEKKERQIELLQEKRTALIGHVVTKGLNPKARMKDSGIEWFGEVPTHWAAVRFKYLLTEPLLYGANEAAELDDPSLPRFIRITDVNEDGTLKEDTFKSLPEEIARPYLLKDGDLLFARSGATVGKTFFFQDLWGRAAFAGYLIRARISAKRMLPKYAAFFTRSSIYWDWLKSIFIQSTIQNVSAEKYANLILCVPPLEEQREILHYLELQASHIDSLSSKILTSILSLHEYRSALITAAVTGKIDVRGEVS